MSLAENFNLGLNYKFVFCHKKSIFYPMEHRYIPWQLRTFWLKVANFLVFDWKSSVWHFWMKSPNLLQKPPFCNQLSYFLSVAGTEQPFWKIVLFFPIPGRPHQSWARGSTVLHSCLKMIPLKERTIFPRILNNYPFPQLLGWNPLKQKFVCKFGVP